MIRIKGLLAGLAVLSSLGLWSVFAWGQGATGKPSTGSSPPQAAESIFTGHAEPRLRGAMVSPAINDAGLTTFGREWRANLIRWQLVLVPKAGVKPTPAEYDAWLETQLKRLDAVLPVCEKAGLHVALDLHSPPGGSRSAGGYIGAEGTFFTDRAGQDQFVRVWQTMARRYRGNKTIWGFDLVNEPIEKTPGEGCNNWHDLAERAAKAVREIDPDRAIIVEPPIGGGPDGLRNFAPLSVSGVVYSIHMYLPHDFTHQGLYGRPGEVKYPGQIDGRMWDKAALEKALQPAVDFQKAHHVQIFVGEFSAIRWAPDNSAYRYLKDVIDIFEAHGWDWTYHAFREWNGWSVEYSGAKSDTRPADEPTDREKLLRSWFEKNEKPAAR